MNKMNKIISVVVLLAVVLSSFTVFADGPFTKNITKTAGYDNLIKIKGDIDRESNITLLVLKTGNYADANVNNVRKDTMASSLATSTIGFVSEQYCKVNSGDFNDFDFSFYVPDGAEDGDFYTIWVGNTQTGNTILESGFIYRKFDPKVSLVKTDDEGQETTDYTSKVAVATSGFSTYSYFPLASGKISDQVDIKRWKLFDDANGATEIKTSVNSNFAIATYSGLKALQIKNNAVATNANTKDLYIRGYYLDNAYDSASARPSGNGIDYSQLKYAATTGTTAFLDNYIEGKITVLPPAKLASFTSSNSGNNYTFTLTSDNAYAQSGDVNYDIQYKLFGGANVSFTGVSVNGNTATKTFDVSTLPAGDYYITGTVANKYSQQVVQDKKTLETTVSATGSGPLYKIKKVAVPETVVAGTSATFTASVFNGTTAVTSGIDTLVKIYDRVDKVGNPVNNVSEINGDGVVNITLPKVGEYVMTFSVKKNGDTEYHSAATVLVSAVESATLTSADFVTSFAVDGKDILITPSSNFGQGYSMFVALENANKEFDSAMNYEDSVTLENGKIRVAIPEKLADAEITSAVVSYRSNATGQVYTYIADITE